MAEQGRLWAVAVLCLASLTGGSRAAQPDGAAEEARLLASLGGSATRQGPRLQLRATNGQVVTFDSNHPDADHEAQVEDYRLTGVTPDGKFFTVYGLFYETETTYWVSRATGAKTEVHAEPAVSPDGRYAVTALAREAFGPEGVFIWEIAGDQLVQRARLKHGDYGLFTFKRWTDKDTAELALYSHSFLNFCPGATSTTAIVRLMHDRRGWTLSEPASARDVRCE